MVNIIEVAKQGRKYGIGVGFICNSPDDLDKELLAQCQIIYPIASGYFVTNYPLIKKKRG